jgi:hypothetical protein
VLHGTRSRSSHQVLEGRPEPRIREERVEDEPLTGRPLRMTGAAVRERPARRCASRIPQLAARSRFSSPPGVERPRPNFTRSAPERVREVHSRGMSQPASRRRRGFNVVHSRTACRSAARGTASPRGR